MSRALQVLSHGQQPQGPQPASSIQRHLHQPTAADGRLLVLVADHAHRAAHTGEKPAELALLAPSAPAQQQQH